MGFDLLSFWQWSSSVVVSKCDPGVLAEYPSIEMVPHCT